jgi:predicted nucleic acid-binding protein
VKLVDTSCWVEYLRTTKTDVSVEARTLLESGEAAWCDIVAMELANTTATHQLPRLQKVQRLALCVETTGAVWNLARRLVHRARRAGVTAPLPDYIVFACCKIHDLEIIHRGDTDFDRLEAVYRSF